MKRPSYLQQIAPRAAGRERGGVAVLVPPRQLFRPARRTPSSWKSSRRAARPLCADRCGAGERLCRRRTPRLKRGQPRRLHRCGGTRTARLLRRALRSQSRSRHPPTFAATAPSGRHGRHPARERRRRRSPAADPRQRSPPAAEPVVRLGRRRIGFTPGASAACPEPRGAARDSAMTPSAAPAAPQPATTLSPALSIAAADHGATALELPQLAASVAGRSVSAPGGLPEGRVAPRP